MLTKKNYVKTGVQFKVNLLTGLVQVISALYNEMQGVLKQLLDWETIG